MTKEHSEPIDTSPPVQPVVHTPGPWAEDSIDIDGDLRPMDTREFGYTRIRGSNGDLIVADMDVSTPDGMANARLIAATPDMWQVVQALATADWFGESEMSFLVKECRRIMREVV